MNFDNFFEWQDWFVRFNNPTLSEMWENQPTFLLANALYILMAMMSLEFALRHGWNSRYNNVYIPHYSKIN